MNPLIIPRLPIQKNQQTNMKRSLRNISTAFTQRIASPRLTSRRIIRSGEPYDEPETLAAEKFQLLSEIKQLQKDIAPLYQKIDQFQAKIDEKNEEMIKYQDKFSSHKQAMEAQNKVEDEKTLLKLQKLFDKSEYQYHQLSSYINIENERKFKSEFILQKQVLGLLRHEIGVIDEKQKEIDEQLNSDEFSQRRLILDELHEKIIQKRAELREENLLTRKLVDSIQSTPVLKPKTEKELKDEIAKLKHQLVTIQAIETKATRERAPSPYKVKQPGTPHISPKRPPPKQEQKLPPAPVQEVPQRKIHDDDYYSDYYSEDEEPPKPVTQPQCNAEDTTNKEENELDGNDFECDEQSEGNEIKINDSDKASENGNDSFDDDFEDDDFVESKQEEDNNEADNPHDDGFDIDLFKITQSRTNN